MPQRRMIRLNRQCGYMASVSNLFFFLNGENQMSFGTRVLELAKDASLQVSDVNERRGLISFNVEGRKQVVCDHPL